MDRKHCCTPPTARARRPAMLRELDEIRFVEKFSIDPSGCWLWESTMGYKGYGRFWYQGRMRSAHRLAYEEYVEPIPEGLTLDHLCRVRNCIAPDHLEPVTNKENLLRGFGVSAINARKQECVKGHPFSEQNTRYAIHRTKGRPPYRERMCIECKRATNRATRARKRTNGNI